MEISNIKIISTKQCAECKVTKNCEDEFYKVQRTNQRVQKYRTLCIECHNRQCAAKRALRVERGIQKKQEYIKAPPKGERNYKFKALPIEQQDYLRFMKYKNISVTTIHRTLEIPNKSHSSINYMIKSNIPKWNPEDPMPKGLLEILQNKGVTIL